MDIDLSSPKYYSDGEGDQPPDDLLPHCERAPDDIFLTHLNEVYNRYVDKDQHLTSLPKGYTMYYCNLVIHGIRQSDGFRSTHIFGHPKGSYSAEQTCIHIILHDPPSANQPSRRLVHDASPSIVHQPNRQPVKMTNAPNNPRSAPALDPRTIRNTSIVDDLPTRSIDLSALQYRSDGDLINIAGYPPK
ncbi:hypothetical protein D6C81_07807 [Aureobasidium pullulans]|nr:hypothetical protein D6C81_07807 [Aureobasidium pullulans]